MTTVAHKARYRPDKDGTHRAAFDRNKKIIYATQTVCAICGQPVEKDGTKWKYHYPHPGSPSVDHIIPVSKGGHPSDLANLQLAHLACNRQKSDRVGDTYINKEEKTTDNQQPDAVSNRVLPQTINWHTYRG